MGSVFIVTAWSDPAHFLTYKLILTHKTMIATTIDQSKRLLAAGVERKSADMRWTASPFGWHLDLGYSPAMNNPAWSLSALWDLFYSMDKTHEFDTDMTSEELIETLVCIITYKKK